MRYRSVSCTFRLTATGMHFPPIQMWYSMGKSHPAPVPWFSKTKRGVLTARNSFAMGGGQHDAGVADEVVRTTEGEEASIAEPPPHFLDELPKDLVVQAVQSLNVTSSPLCDLQAAGKAIHRGNAKLMESINHDKQAVQLVYQGYKGSPVNKVEAAELKDKMARAAADFAEVSATQDRIKAMEARLVMMQDAETKAEVHHAEVMLHHAEAKVARHDAEVLSQAKRGLARHVLGSWEHTAPLLHRKAAAKLWERAAELSLGPAQKDLCRSKAAAHRRKIPAKEAAEVKTKAVRMAEAEAKANAAADALLAEEAVEKAAAASAGKARGKGKSKPKGKGKRSGNAVAQADKAEVCRRHWQKAIRLVIAQARADAKATADNAAAAAKQRAVRERAGAAASAKAEPGYTPAGPSHKGPAVAWGEEAPDARDKAKRLTAKEASIEAAKKAEAEKKAEKDRKTAERLEQFRNVRIGEAITSGK